MAWNVTGAPSAEVSSHWTLRNCGSGVIGQDSPATAPITSTAGVRSSYGGSPWPFAARSSRKLMTWGCLVWGSSTGSSGMKLMKGDGGCVD